MYLMDGIYPKVFIIKKILSNIKLQVCDCDTISFGTVNEILPTLQLKVIF